jgi:hypothetical protein
MEMAAAGVQFVKLNPIEKAKKNPKSLTMAVRAKCFECCGSGQDSNVRQTVADCTVHLCPLHPHRPWQNKREDA